MLISNARSGGSKRAISKLPGQPRYFSASAARPRCFKELGGRTTGDVGVNLLKNFARRKSLPSETFRSRACERVIVTGKIEPTPTVYSENVSKR